MKYLFRILTPTFVRGGLGAACFLFLLGCTTTGTHSPESGHAAANQGTPTSLQGVDLLREGELILIEFSGVSDPPERHEERIKTDGRVTLPNIGPIQAAGRTRGELEAAIHDAYVPNYYRTLTVTVRNEGRFFYVNGQVKNPGQFPYMKEMTVLKAIAVASDFTDFAKKTEVLVTRADGRKITVNCQKAKRDPRLDVAIYPDDVIDVPRRYF